MSYISDIKIFYLHKLYIKKKEIFLQKILSFKTNGSLGYRIRSYITVLDIGGGNSQALTAVDPIIDGTGLLFFGPLLVGHRSNRME